MEDKKQVINHHKGDEGLGEFGESDTCRICRGEGDPSESLFHPCKCSGSIKYVHQECLMEWLSHSQKKYCELCKTAFRFTKLYSDDMPQFLPFHILIRHVLKHSVRVLFTLLRFCLVVMVWLGLLPYTIRQVWRFLFWFSEGGWPPSDLTTLYKNSSNITQTLQVAQAGELTTLINNAAALATPISTNMTNSVYMRTVVNRLTQFLIPTSYALRISGSDDVTTSLFKSIYNGLGIQNSDKSERAMNKSSLFVTSRSSSLLSEISFFKNLTPNSSFNQLVISVTEGYIITVLVVVCFVLVFLIREWVVQQQPGINMGVGFNAEFAPNERPRDEQQDHGTFANTQGEIDTTNDDGQIPTRNVMQVNHDSGHLNVTESTETGQLVASRNAIVAAAEEQRGITNEPLAAGELFEPWGRTGGNLRENKRIIQTEGKLDTPSKSSNTIEIPEDSSESFRRALQNSKLESTSFIWADETSQTSSGTIEIMKQGQTHNDSKKSTSITCLAALSESSRVKTISRSPRHDSAVHPNISEIDTTSDKFKGKSRIHDNEPKKSIEIKNLNADGIATDDLPNYEITLSPLRSWENNNIGSKSKNRAMSDSSQSKTPPLDSKSWSSPEDVVEREKEILEFSDKSLIGRANDIKNKDSGTSEDVDEIHDITIKNESEKTIVCEASNHFSSHETLILEQEACQNWAQHQTFDERFEKGEINTENDSEVSTNKPIPVIETRVDSNGIVNIQTDSPPLDANVPQLVDPVIARPVSHAILGTVTDYMWGGVDDRSNGNIAVNGEIIHIEAEIPPAPAANHDIFDLENNVEVIREAALGVIAEGIDVNDPEAIEDAEDFEGIMELLGMRGPIFSLVQNALFSALLLGLTIIIGVWFPYNIGRVSLLLLANPGPTLRVPLKMLFGCAALMQDLALSFLGFLSLICIQLFAQPYKILSSYFGLGSSFITSQTNFLTSTAIDISSAAIQRIKYDAVNNFMYITDSEMSAVCHESLITIQNLVSTSLIKIGAVTVFLFTKDYHPTLESIVASSKISSTNGVKFLKSLPSSLFKSDLWTINLEGKKRTAPIDLELSVWSGIDRFLAVVTGYIVLCALGTLYVRKRSPLLSGQVGRELEMMIVDSLRQAGGVMKVILIISIEMLAFPLYCGLLLDISLLPLFENTTITSRVVFTLKSPMTSIFVHWFVGTCYMFHFALFVSMCRKIMRKGVLYFIRDPDDPTFHPVRDVLERNVTTQLQKILFSALVYGALILICLGGVVWGISITFKGVLPIHWSSNDPVLEFPIDLLFYNFLIPFAVKLFKPSSKLHAMYSWWFRKCARTLRLTWFLFDERKLDEERHLVRKTWSDSFRRTKADPKFLVISGDPNDVFESHPDLRAYYHRDGRYVRAPGSDQVRIPKGSSIFLEVNEWNERIDQLPDRNDGIHGKDSDLYKLVYIPPWFRVRISMFIISIWIFAAITGVSVTIIPLVVGRIVFANVVPPQVRENDAYAFSIGIYILGSIIYCALNFREMLTPALNVFLLNENTPKKLLNYMLSVYTQAVRITWTYTAFLFILPTLFAFLVEFYLIVPLHTFLAMEEKHVVHFVQSWTLGLLYVKLTARLILWHEHSRPAQSLRAITRNGYLNPDARLATRSFILPGALLLFTALFYPWVLARLTVVTVLQRFPEKHTLAYRYSYPICLCLCFLVLVLWVLTGWVRKWKIKIRDEAYLVGEQLHNFEEKKIQRAQQN